MDRIGTMLQSKMTSDIDGVKQKYKVIHDQIDNAMEAEKYQDEDVVRGVIQLEQAASCRICRHSLMPLSGASQKVRIHIKEPAMSSRTTSVYRAFSR